MVHFSPRRVVVEALQVSAFTIPTSSPEADGTLEWDKTTIVIVDVAAGGERGLGYTYADLATANLIDHVLRKELEGADAMSPPAAWNAMVRRIRNLGRPGIC